MNQGQSDNRVIPSQVHLSNCDATSVNWTIVVKIRMTNLHDGKTNISAWSNRVTCKNDWNMNLSCTILKHNAYAFAPWSIAPGFLNDF
jgi:hypothetical protein